MAHVPIDDTGNLFAWTTAKTWSEFLRVLQQQRGKANRISDALIDVTMPIAQRFERSGKPFPSTPRQLQKLLNQKLMRTR